MLHFVAVFFLSALFILPEGINDYEKLFPFLPEARPQNDVFFFHFLEAALSLAVGQLKPSLLVTIFVKKR